MGSKRFGGRLLRVLLSWRAERTSRTVAEVLAASAEAAKRVVKCILASSLAGVADTCNVERDATDAAREGASEVQ